jgi:CHAD domain-containing protein
MKTMDAIEKLGRTHLIEWPHVKQVAVLSLSLFDGFAEAKGFLRKDRRLLEAACLLHDIGYAAAPAGHELVGKAILEENPVVGFGGDEWKMVVAIAMLHCRQWQRVLELEPLLSMTARQQDRAKKMAAILRIADGLDHGHVQDARVLSCKQGRRRDKVKVEIGWYGGNVVRAEGKSDLWEAVFKRPFSIKAKELETRFLWSGVVFKGDTAVAAGRRILYAQYNIMRDQIAGMVEGGASDYLHEYRVALRRFRVALRFFGPLLQGTGAAALSDRLGAMSERLGPIRDTHVCLQLLKALQEETGVEDRLVEVVEAEVRTANMALVEIMQSEYGLTLMDALARFLRVELPDVELRSAELSFIAYAKSTWGGMEQRLKRMDEAALEGPIEQLHAARKEMRRARYYAEFCAPVLGGAMGKKALRLKRVAGAMGDLHDVALHRVRFEAAAVHEAYLARLRERDLESRAALKSWWPPLT